MRKTLLLSTVAATLLLTAAAVSAQAIKKDEAPAPAPAAQQNAPAEKAAPTMKGSSDADRRTDVKSKTNENAAQGAVNSKSNQPVTTEKERSTTGQGAAAGSAKLSTEQRSKITTIFKQQKVEPAHLTVSVRIGTRVPESVHFYSVPIEVVDVYPEWRGYDYILIGDEILVIDPRTHEIVAILDA
jgi:hypothetical protein